MLSDAEEVARYAARPTDMLERQIAALRNAIRYRNPETGRRSFAHEVQYRHRFGMSVRVMRAELRSRSFASTH